MVGSDEERALCRRCGRHKPLLLRFVEFAVHRVAGSLAVEVLLERVHQEEVCMAEVYDGDYASLDRGYLRLPRIEAEQGVAVVVVPCRDVHVDAGVGQALEDRLRRLVVAGHAEPQRDVAEHGDASRKGVHRENGVHGFFQQRVLVCRLGSPL